MASRYHKLKDLKNLSREELNNILLECSGYKFWMDKKKLAKHIYKYKNNKTMEELLMLDLISLQDFVTLIVYSPYSDDYVRKAIILEEKSIKDGDYKDKDINYDYNKECYIEVKEEEKEEEEKEDEEKEDEEKEEEKWNENKNDVIKFFSKSKDSKPCKGAGESYFSNYDYSKLEKIKNWRHVLSNFHMYNFVWNGFTWKSIEHAYQSAKINLVDKEKAFHFTIESGNIIGQSDASVAQKNRKYVLLNESQQKEWNKISSDIMEKIAIEKYKQCSDALNILKLTGNAELWHIVSRKPAVRFFHLEKIRNNL